MKRLTAKVVYKPIGLGLGMVAGAVATATTRRLWGLLRNQDRLPTARDPDNAWTDILVAAALQGAIFALAKAAADRLEAAAISRATGAGSR